MQVSATGSTSQLMHNSTCSNMQHTQTHTYTTRRPFLHCILLSPTGTMPCSTGTMPISTGAMPISLGAMPGLCSP